MASVTDTVERMIHRFPSLYANRTQCLHALFYVLGNGYDWSAGELVDITRDDRTEEDADAVFLAPLIARHGPDHPIVAQTTARFAADRAPTLSRRGRAAELARTPGELGPHDPYPLTTGCALSTMPADATADWRAAADEITAAVAEHVNTGKYSGIHERITTFHEHRPG